MGAFNKFMAYTFAVLLAKPFKEWDAFKAGLIDIKGNLIKKPKTPEEKKLLDTFKNLIRKIKKLMVKFVPDNKFLTFMITAYLLKSESENYNEDHIEFMCMVEKELTEEDVIRIKDTLNQITKMSINY